MQITVEATVKAPVDAVWQAWTTPDDIVQWNTASEDWHTTAAEIDLRVGGRFSYRMEAKDGSMGFDFTGVFTKLIEQELIEFSLDDDRSVSVNFTSFDEGVTVRETFEAESANAGEQQRQGWQAILDNFAKYVEEKC